MLYIDALHPFLRQTFVQRCLCSVQFSSVQGGSYNYALYRCAPPVSQTVQFKMVPIRSEKPIIMCFSEVSPTLPFLRSAVQFGSRWHLYARESPYAFYPFLKHFPQRCPSSVQSSVQFSSRWHLYARESPYALYPFLKHFPQRCPSSVQFKVASIRSKKAIRALSVSQKFPNVAFVQSEMAYIHTRSENPITMRSTPSLRSFPNILFETVPVFV